LNLALLHSCHIILILSCISNCRFHLGLVWFGLVRFIAVVSLGIPFGHWQIDSWFYPKDGQTSRGGKGGAVLNWTALPEIFPSGVSGFQEKLGGMPLIMHNRQFSNHSDYILNWTDIEWYKGPMYAMPHDPEKFFRRFFTQQVGWGLAMYEQDWMKDQVRAINGKGVAMIVFVCF
jgi:hypothetical protein